MINVINISKVYDGEYIFKDMNFTIKERDRIGIIGNNGVGKTTLFKCILDDRNITSGEILKDKGKLGYLSQHVIDNYEHTVKEEYNNIFKELTNIENKMEQIVSFIDQDDDKLTEYGQLESRYMYLGGYEKDSKIDMMMSKFGFSKQDLNKKISDFSGGQITKLALIKLLLITPDYLFLDEPTNHLDIETITWLEDYLKNYEGAVIIISHDRYFIDRVVNKIVDIQNKTAQIYNTNFTNYLIERKYRYDIALATYENQQQEIKKLNDFIIKFRGKPSKIGQVNDRKNKLSRMKIVEKPVEIREKVNFTIQDLNVKKAFYIDMIDVDVGYDKVLIKDFNLKVLGGEKIGIIGPNGVGKSTLLKTILKEIKPLKGNSVLHHSIKIGYFSQTQDSFDEELTIYDYIYKYMPDNSTGYIRSYLARFLFKRDDVYKKIKKLSGGEKVRLTLAIFTLEKYDMIVLDEPTNHLDFETKQILQLAIEDYKGTVICVSHDRYFIDAIATKFIYLKENSYHIYEGHYHDCEQFIFEFKAKEKTKEKQKTPKANKSLEKQITKLEKEIMKLEEEKEELFIKSAEPEIYSDYLKSQELNDRIKDIENLIVEKYDQYEDLTQTQ